MLIEWKSIYVLLIIIKLALAVCTTRGNIVQSIIVIAVENDCIIFLSEISK